MKSKHIFFIAVLVLSHYVNETLANGFENSLKFPEIAGMDIEHNYPVFTGEDLWDYINGASDGYLAFHFQNLNIAEYVDAEKNTVKVEVYTHQRPEDAYGIYATERSPDYHFIDIGAEGYAEKGLINFVAGNYYVKVIAGSGSVVSNEILMQIASKVCGSLVEKAVLPKALSVFPADGKIAHSESFVASTVLGNEFLKDAFLAKYKTEDGSFSILIFMRNDPEGAVQILKDYYKYTKEPLPASWDNGKYTINDKYNGTIHFYLRDEVLFGFLELEEMEIMDRYINEILANLNK